MALVSRGLGISWEKNAFSKIMEMSDAAEVGGKKNESMTLTSDESERKGSDEKRQNEAEED